LIGLGDGSGVGVEGGREPAERTGGAATKGALAGAQPVLLGHRDALVDVVLCDLLEVGAGLGVHGVLLWRDGEWG